MKYQITIWTIVLLTLLGCDNQTETQFDILIVNAQIVDVESGTVSKDKLIGIVDDTIRLVADMELNQKVGATTVIDADGKFVMPGLWDMHVHFRGGDSLIEENKNLLPLFIAHGVTTVRDAGGDITPSVKDWADKGSKGLLVGPDIFTSGPKLDGPDPRWAGSIEIETSDQVIWALDSLQKIGVDYVKTYDSKLSEDIYYQIVQESQSRGLDITGHMPMDADLMHAFDLGLDGIEHLYYLLAQTSTIGDSIRSLGLGYGALSQLLESQDEDLQASVFTKLGKKRFYATPTLYIGEILADLHHTDHEADPLLKSIGPGIQQTYAGRTISARARSSARQLQEVKMRQTFNDMVQPLHDAGVKILAGSDCGAFNSYVYPGLSLHGELQSLVKSGLSPRQALACSIINGPDFLGASNFFGQIEEGKLGHIIMMAENPLEDVDALTDLECVIKDDMVYGKQALAALKSSRY